MGLKGFMEGVKVLQGRRVGSEPTGWRTWMKLIQGQGQDGERGEGED